LGALRCTELLEQVVGPGQVLDGTAQIALSLMQHAQVVQAAGDTMLVTEGSLDGEGLLVALVGLGVVDLHNQHKLYLRRLFNKPWAEVSLADMAQSATFGAGDRQLILCDVYVPLPTDLRLTVRMLDVKIIE